MIWTLRLVSFVAPLALSGACAPPRASVAAVTPPPTYPVRDPPVVEVIPYHLPPEWVAAGAYPLRWEQLDREVAVRTGLEPAFEVLAVSYGPLQTHAQLGPTEAVLDSIPALYDRGVPPGYPLPVFDAFSERFASACGYPSELQWGTARVVSPAASGRMGVSRSGWQVLSGPAGSDAAFVVYEISAYRETTTGPWSVSCLVRLPALDDSWRSRPELWSHPALELVEHRAVTPGVLHPPAAPVMGWFEETGPPVSSEERRLPQPYEVSVTLGMEFRCDEGWMEARVVARYALTDSAAAGRTAMESGRKVVTEVHRLEPFPVLDALTGEVVDGTDPLGCP